MLTSFLLVTASSQLRIDSAYPSPDTAQAAGSICNPVPQSPVLLVVA
jgi:hypothetical protein